ncbi:SKI family transcriptional corepressor 1 like protein [Argiope bruennichi]|uniref:SKI family transcriptional corepressor 1 like protein n=1 Tax=Argiope bruennichi TaxID=94029 RepID=A0A8T0FTX9_ARGBR|nr:SKI family transcriptional corepressor 1 like protein [Argiope bruennichi]
MNTKQPQLRTADSSTPHAERHRRWIQTRQEHYIIMLVTEARIYQFTHFPWCKRQNLIFSALNYRLIINDKKNDIGVVSDPRAPKSQSIPSSTTSDRNILFNGPPLSGLRNNDVRTVMLYGVPIVALVIEGYERLCLAQISNTLLKSFSYNEIHNRRVALGITCVQCTPVQLELLRRAGAMPVSSRRCGLITKREAERLCKSFLADTKPPKLPDNFAFDVVHQCAWGCRGSFVPSRYNSSRAKCIKCTFCGLFFSPNKFIFHSHRLPDSKYVQPDAANFNSWRRHIKLGGNPPDEVVYAWEDVKAMFNGGSRKRVLSCASVSNSSGRHGDGSKRPRNPTRPDSVPSSSEAAVHTKPPYFPVVPLPNKGFSLAPAAAPFVPPTGPTPFGMATGKSLSPADIRQTFAEYMWAGKQPFPLPFGGVLWPRPGGIVPSAPTVELREARSVPEPSMPYSLADTTTLADTGRPLSSASEGTSLSFPDHDSPGSPLRSTPAHTSAFRPVGRRSPPRIDSDADTTTAYGGGTERRCGSCCGMSSGDEVDVTDISNDGESASAASAPVDELTTAAVPDTSAESTAARKAVSITID